MSDVDASRLVVVLAVDLAAIAVLMGATMVLALHRRKHSIVDVLWGLGFATVAVATWATTAGTGDETRRLLVLVLPLVWGVRLAVHIGRRNAGRPEDPRYEELLARAHGSAASVVLRRIYLPQGAVMFLVCLPIPVAAVTSSPLPWWAWAGVAVWALGMFFETVGDWQLDRFRADPASRGRVLDTGLWRYTRHPNYFGDACVWWGVWLLAADSWLGLVTVVCPALMTYFLVAKTGKVLLERSLASSKPGYADYVARTSGFVPLPPRRRGS